MFVDDEKDVLDGLKRMLYDMRKEWKMSFAESGPEALETLSRDRFDVIVTDMRMPGMDGAELLAKVSEEYPDMVRIVLSGHSKQEMIFKSVEAAHQYLAKPCDPEILKSAVQRACALREFLADDRLKQVVTKLDSLPSLPTLVIEINRELQSPDSSLAKVGDIISRDAGMTAKILQLVNSAFFGFFSYISSPSQAVTLLGLDTVRALVTSVHIFSKLKISKVSKISIGELWNHFLSVGAVSKEIAKMELTDDKLIDEAFMAGMLHDIGKIVFISQLTEKYKTVIDSLADEKLNLNDAELKEFGAGHAEVGGYLLGLWGLPDSIIEAVFFHHRPAESMESEFGIISVVHAANALCAGQWSQYTVGELSRIDYEHMEKLGKTDRIPLWTEKCREIISRVTEDGG